MKRAKHEQNLLTSQDFKNSLAFYFFSRFMEVQEKKKRLIAPYAQKSSTVSNLEMRRRLACHVLLLSFLKNHRDHLLSENRKRKPA